MNPQKLRLGISTCPNDTFIYEALIAGIPGSPFRFDVTYADVQTLNEMVIRGELDVAKISCGALRRLDPLYRILDCGGAVGYGCGPLLLSSSSDAFDPSLPTELPGRDTTAALLFRHWAQGNVPAVSAPVSYAFFNEVYDHLRLGKSLQGVVIHEHRFTWKRDGLHLLADLGAYWESTLHSPVPLGCAVAKTSLGKSVLAEIEAEIRRSLDIARNRKVLVTPFIRDKAQINDDSIIEAHIRMFVTDFSFSMGEAGKRALSRLRDLF